GVGLRLSAGAGGGPLFLLSFADGNGILGRQERERLANELPGFFLPFVLLDDNDGLRGPSQGRRGGVLVGTPADSIGGGDHDVDTMNDVDH
ncbi:MAG: hypothetical protein P8N31_06100, partial [Planctomycetota bacterium]|nr:hypothetical protein [Planctomycetota bacterium]